MSRIYKKKEDGIDKLLEDWLKSNKEPSSLKTDKELQKKKDKRNNITLSQDEIQYAR